MMCGGLSGVKVADAETQTLINKVKHLLSAKINKEFQTYQAIEYATQVVAGTNYFVKVLLDDGEYAHLRIYVPLPHAGSEPQLHGVEHPKTKDAPIQYIKQD